MPIIEERWKEIQNLSLKFGGHKPDSQFCVMEAAAYIAGESWSDHPVCVPRTIAAVLRRWNDALPSDRDRDRLLKPFLPRIIGLHADAKTEMRRAVMCGDFALRFVIPEYLRYAKKKGLAEELAATSESTTQAELKIAAKSVRNKLRAIASAIDIASASDIAIDIASASAIAIDIDIASASDIAIAIAIASAIDIAIDIAIASASAIAIDIDIASAIAVNQKLEVAKLALVERMISCAE
jgi:hypothetical protein